MLVSSRGRLKARYGQRGVDILQDCLDRFRASLSERSVTLVTAYVDDRSSVSQFGVTPASRITASSVKTVVDTLRAKVSGRAKAPVSILILGGHEVIPYFKLANPAFDSDKEVLSDNPYGCPPGGVGSDRYLLPEVPVGRIPDGDGSNVELLTRQIELSSRALTVAAGGPAPAPADSLSYTAAIWQKASRDVATGLGWKASLKISPPLTYIAVKSGWFDRKRFLYFNLHGSDREPYWFGQKGESYPTALSPANVTNFSRGANAVLTEACYGAIEAGRTCETSIALAFLATGSVCFVGSTCIAYGALVPPVSEADLIALHFFRNVQRGMTLGKALVNARAQLAGLAVSKQGYLDEDDRKTLLQFVLFGDPTQRLHPGV